MQYRSDSTHSSQSLEGPNHICVTVNWIIQPDFYVNLNQHTPVSTKHSFFAETVKKCDFIFSGISMDFWQQKLLFQ